MSATAEREDPVGAAQRQATFAELFFNLSETEQERFLDGLRARDEAFLGKFAAILASEPRPISTKRCLQLEAIIDENAPSNTAARAALHDLLKPFAAGQRAADRAIKA